MATELTRLGTETDDAENAFRGHQHAWGAQMVRGDIAAADAELASMAEFAVRCASPPSSGARNVAGGARHVRRTLLRRPSA